MAVPYAPARWPAVTATTALWALAAASIVFWGLRLTAPADALAPPPVANTAPVAVDPAAVAQMLGVVAPKVAVVATPDAASRFALLGVVADGDDRGVVLMSVDGKPARPFRVGATVADGYVLQSVTLRAAALGASLESAPALTLQMPVKPFASNPPRPESEMAPVIAPAAPR